MLHTPSLFTGDMLSPTWPFGAIEPYSADLILADPPWDFANWSDKGERKSAKLHYATMSIEAIAGLPVRHLAASDCLLWLWATAPMLPQALGVMAAWGFRYVTMGAWHKRTAHNKTAFGTGYVLRSAMEPWLIGKCGEPSTTRAVRNIVVGCVREHSRKPDEAFRAAEALMPSARRVELFSRQSRPGWVTWGGEVGKFDGVNGCGGVEYGKAC